MSLPANTTGNSTPNAPPPIQSLRDAVRSAERAAATARPGCPVVLTPYVADWLIRAARAQLEQQETVP